MSEIARRFVPASTYTDRDDLLAFGPEQAGWAYCGLRVVDLAAGEERTLATGDTELFVLPLSATGLTVSVASSTGDETFAVEGRTSVFARVTDFVYVGRGSELTLSSSSGGEVALPSARCDRALPPKYGPAGNVGVETRGAGPATRQVANFASPEAWDHADKLGRLGSVRRSWCARIARAECGRLRR